MPRIRSLKPDFFADEDLAELPFWVRLLYAGLWCQADKAGRLEDRPAKLKATIFPYDKVNVENGLQLLAKPKKHSPTHPPFIVRYEIKGQRYIQILTWDRHESPHHTERESEIPPYNGELTVIKPLDKSQMGDEHYPISYPKSKEGSKEGSMGGEIKKLKPIEIIARGLAELLSGEMKKNNPMYLEKPKQIDSWADEIRLMFERDGRKLADIRAVILWCQADPFWRKNIESAGKLREKFARLWIQMKEPAGKKEKTPEELNEETRKALEGRK